MADYLPASLSDPANLGGEEQGMGRGGHSLLNVSLLEVAAVCQLVGLAGGALGDVLGHTQGHRLHFRTHRARGIRALCAPSSNPVRQAGDLGPQLRGGLPQGPGQPPLAEGRGRLATPASGRSRPLGRSGAIGAGEGQRDPGQHGARAGGAVRVRTCPGARGPPVVAVDAPDGATAAAVATLAAQQPEEGALELAAGARVDERVHTAVEVAQPEDDLEDALRWLQLREQGACGENPGL